MFSTHTHTHTHTHTYIYIYMGKNMIMIMTKKMEMCFRKMRLTMKCTSKDDCGAISQSIILRWDSGHAGGLC